MRLKYSKQALLDTIRLRESIAEHNIETAQRVSLRLIGAISRLKDMPGLGRQVGTLPGEVRELVFGTYVIRYEIKPHEIYILRIWHGRENRR